MVIYNEGKHKEKCRLQFERAVFSKFKDTSKLIALTLPSDSFVLERRLASKFKYILCAESDPETWKSGQKQTLPLLTTDNKYCGVFSEGGLVEYHNDRVLNVVPEPKYVNGIRVAWFDWCNYLNEENIITLDKYFKQHPKTSGGILAITVLAMREPKKVQHVMNFYGKNRNEAILRIVNKIASKYNLRAYPMFSYRYFSGSVMLYMQFEIGANVRVSQRLTRDEIRERTIAGLKTAKSKGKQIGRPKIHDYDKIRELRAKGLSYRQIVEETGCNMGTVNIALKGESND